MFKGWVCLTQTQTMKYSLSMPTTQHNQSPQSNLAHLFRLNLDSHNIQSLFIFSVKLLWPPHDIWTVLEPRQISFCKLTKYPSLAWEPWYNYPLSPTSISYPFPHLHSIHKRYVKMTAAMTASFDVSKAGKYPVVLSDALLGKSSNDTITSIRCLSPIHLDG